MDNVGQMYVVVGIAIFVAALIGLWLISKKAPKGMVLGICIILYLTGCLINPGMSRELVGIKGLLKMIGFFGGILGLVDLLRKRGGTKETP